MFRILIAEDDSELSLMFQRFLTRNGFSVTTVTNGENSIEEYIYFFNNERPAYALNYPTPKQFKDKYLV